MTLGPTEAVARRLERVQSLVAVVLSGDGDALDAVGWAAREAVLRHAQLELVQCLPQAEGEEAARHRQRARAMQAMDAALQHARESARGVDVRVRSVETDLAQLLADESRRAAMLVVGGSVPSGPGSVLGWRVQTLLELVACPVVVVPKDAAVLSLVPQQARREQR